MNSNFATTILKWFAENGRELPWRGTRDPYAIWLSEIILQQTRIDQGWAYWERFMQKWPTVESLAAATEDEVLRMWQGLGYYSRARNLHTAARQIVAMGHFPHTVEDIKRLKGVGDYTAAAIGSIAFGQPAAVVDGNVYRVLARHFGIDTPINTTKGKKLFAKLAQELLPASEASAYNQGLMDFGAMQCTPSSPRCDICPLAMTCDAFRTGSVNLLPVKEKSLKIKTRHLSYYYIKCGHHVAFHQRRAGDIWQGLWEPLLVEDGDAPQFDNPPTLLRQGIKHILTHRVLIADFYMVETESRPTLPDDYQWIDEDNICQHAVPRLVEILLECVEQERQKNTDE